MIDDFAELKQHRLTPEMVQMVAERRVAFDARKIRKKRQKFIMMPWSWHERLKGASGQTYRLAHMLLWLYWRQNGGAVKLTNIALEAEGISRHSKYRALSDLKQRALIAVEHRQRRSPMVTLYF